MKANAFWPGLCLWIAAAAALFWLGCQHDRSSAVTTPSVVTDSPSSEETAWEYKTVEKEMSEDELRQSMEDWREQGWAVLSISAPVQQADGTVHRKVELRRAKP